MLRGAGPGGRCERRAGAVEITGTRGELTFDQVDFGYEPSRLILEDVDLEVGSGQTVAFVGGTGAGKSTLLSLAPRFYDPNRGRVLLDGKDLRTITKKSLRQQISIVLQDTLLFSTTIRENIAYGKPEATEEEIIEAAKRRRRTTLSCGCRRVTPRRWVNEAAI